MHELKIYNTLSRKIEEFKPLKGNEVSFYHCGPTVYWTQHIGNMRAMVIADLFDRSLEYLGYKVKLVRNYTDVGHLTSDEDEGEDKMSKTAIKEKKDPNEIAEKYIEIFEQDIADLNIREPYKKPKATKHVKEMQKMVEILLKKGFAYSTDLAIYFDVTKFSDYTKLSGRDLDKDISSAGKGDVSDPNKKHSADFALWFFKAGVHKNALQTWKSNFKSPLVENGEGFPGWHIECSAMSQKYLGDTMDIHMGGVEHVSIHHSNEIAQSESATGKKFVNYWIHNEHLNVDGGKMSKSSGTAYTIDDLKNKGYDPLALRYFFMQAHYRSKQNFTFKALEGAQNALVELKNKIRVMPDKGKVIDSYKNRFLDALADDFGIPQALAIVWELVNSKEDDADKKATILDFDSVLGLKLNEVKNVPKTITKLAEERETARKAKDFTKADEIRDQIEEQGFTVEDSKEGFIIKEK